MKYTIYKTTNIINNKYYIGMHRTNDPNDDYLGSGVALGRAIKKYGVDNFEKEVLFVFENECDMIEKEKELITEDIVNDRASYNMTLGGSGSWYHIDTSGENNPNYGKSIWKKNKTQKEIDEINAKRASHGSKNGMYGKTHTRDAIQRIIKGNEEWRKTPEGIKSAQKQAIALSKRMKGVPKSENQKLKMSESAKRYWDNLPEIVCPNCGKIGKKVKSMERYHFDNCKLSNKNNKVNYDQNNR